ncbi:MAG: aldehyde dehydrogenase family protein [Flavobacteriia bacterium]|nr:aldehyde dehydrogenase family protein [Flavobacteriia bacterium]
MVSLISDLQRLHRAQTDFFMSGATRTYAARKVILKKYRQVILEHEQAIIDALHHDFRKPEWETWTSEIGMVINEIDHALKNLKTWMKPQKVGTPIPLQLGSTRVYREPHGRCVIIAPWNYPVQLLLDPLAACISAGNTALVKPSEFTPATSDVLQSIIEKTFPEEWVKLIQGDGAELFPIILDHYQPQHIFFTGSTAVGRIIGKQAGERLIPCILELGGKSPAVIDGTTPTKVAVRRVLFGKYFNGGQTCVAPDYLLVHKNHIDAFISVFKSELKRSYGEDALQSPDYAAMIHRRAYDRQMDLMKDGTVIVGGKGDESSLKIQPTLLIDVKLDSRVMSEEIFGPVLPVLTYESEDEILKIVSQNPDPLAFYIYSKDKGFQKRLICKISFGSGAINSSTIHFANPHAPMGGVRSSGIGSYHGRAGFDAFSNAKSILNSYTFPDPIFKYAPYSGWSLKLVKRLFRR